MRSCRYNFRTWPAVILIFVFLFAPFAFSKDFETAVPETVDMSSERLARIDTILTKAVDQQRIKGAVAMVARDGKVTYLKAFGEMDNGKPMQKDTIFRICSMTKPIIAVAVMMLWEQGLFGLDDPIHQYIPDFKDVKVLVMDKNEEKGYRLEPVKQPITIRHLLSHTSGISYGFLAPSVVSQCYLENEVSDGFRVTNGTIGEEVKRLAKCPLLFQPGGGWAYGLNFDVLGYFIEVVSGMPLDKFLQTNIFGPLQMKDTSFFVPADKVPRLAALYEPTMKGGLKKVDRRIVTRGFFSEVQSLRYDPFYGYQGPKTYFSGGAGLHSTASDYLRFCQMMLNGGELHGVRLLSPTTVDFMIQNHIDGYVMVLDPKVQKYGLGFSLYVDPVASASPLPKGSYEWLGIYNTKFYIDPKHHMVAIYLTQLFPNMQVNDLNQKFNVLTQQAIVKE
jgi:CubicO group peptidase (beta-lactamase class C family)